jgi:hypothetical protein
MAWLRAGRSKARIPAGTRAFLFSKTSRLILGSAQPLTQWASFPGVRQPGRKVDHSILFGAKVKNEWNYTSYLPSWRAQGNVTFFFTFVSLYWIILPIIYTLRAYVYYEAAIQDCQVASWSACFLKVVPIGCPVPSVSSWQPALGKTQESGDSQLHRGGSLNSRLGCVPTNSRVESSRVESSPAETS